MGVDTRLYRVMWTQAEYPYENGEQILILSSDEAAQLEALGKAAEENDLIADFELLPSTPMILEEFMDAFGEDFSDAVCQHETGDCDDRTMDALRAE